ncbi:uncharacterized protein LOC108028450 [Drosophila biarmipes]|uniref:uncharacterized protein LOC108028450 n=1 Tax=Drosophila biarmipes TaxID=125945 RepID=UPI0007E65C88|nr:uncharacterized protein LOC108028450 [Drosophila biarmipes]
MKIQKYCMGSKSPVFVSHLAPYNFLREYRLLCEDPEIPPTTLIAEAVQAWQALSVEERSLFEETTYLTAKFGQSSKSALRLTIDLLSAQQTTVRRVPSNPSLHTISRKSKKIGNGNSKSVSKKMERKMRSAIKKGVPESDCSWCGASTSKKSSDKCSE